MLRRTFLTLPYATLAVALLPSISYSNKSSFTGWQVRLSTPSMLANISNADTIVALGNTYLNQTASENDITCLINTLIADDHRGRIPVTADASTLQNLMEEKVQNDFEIGETITVNGWILSRTEARQCALFSLTKTEV